HWPAYATSPELAIVAVVERTAERRSVAEAMVPPPRAYESIDALAASEAIDFIDICTPPALHGEPMLAALERGWHVVCEKPFLLDAGVLARARHGGRARPGPPAGAQLEVRADRARGDGAASRRRARTSRAGRSGNRP